MITAQDVIELYRCILGRAPESEDTIEAFRLYYPDFDIGRLAVLGSAEFDGIFARSSGAVTAGLTRLFLQRAGGVAQQEQAPGEPDLAAAMRSMIRAHGAVRLAVVIGPDGPPITDLIPIGNAQAAILHVAADFPAFIPQTATLPDGGTLFRVSFEPSGLAAFLRQAHLSIDLLALYGAPAAWWDALRPCLATRAILGNAGDTAPPPRDWADMEAPIHLPGIDIHHLGGWFLPVAYRPGDATDAVETPIPGLTVAAIVRNEQAAIVNMLMSVAAVAGSFVVVDTGSSDDTYAVAEGFLSGAGTPYILSRTEPGRFDTMRNAALDLVPETAAWVLMLDADEELCEEDRAALRALLADADQDAYALPRYNYLGPDKTGTVTPYPDRQIRLLRRRTDVKLRYEGAVHETVRGVPAIRLPLDATALGLGRGGPHIHHLVRRFRSPEAEARKQDFYRHIAQIHAVDVTEDMA